MKKAIYFFCLIFFLSNGCFNEKGDNIEELMRLDKKVWNYHSLTQFNSFKLFRKEINNIRVCDSLKSRSMTDEKEYTKVLKEIGISKDEFNDLLNQLDIVDYKSYYKYGDYSIWVKNGAYGDIHGHLINHNPEISEIASFKLNDTYYIGIGKKISDNVYYFSSNFY